MNNKTRNTLKLIAVVVVLLAVLMEMQILIIPMLVAYKFWLVVIGFATILLASR